MSILVHCPSCQQSTTYYRPPVAGCPKCQAEYPPAVRGPAEEALGIDPAPRPPILLKVRLATTLGACLLLVFLIAPFDIGSYSIGEEAVSGPEFLRRAGLLFGSIGGLCAIVAVGLWRERPWARPVMAVSLPLAGLAVFITRSALGRPIGDQIASLVALPLMTGGIVWYFYRKADIAAYFRALADRSVKSRRAA